MNLLIAFGCALGIGALVAALTGPGCLFGHRKPSFVSRRHAGFECTRCREVVFNQRKERP